MIQNPDKFEYDCQDVQELLFLYAVWPEETTFDERDETDRHLIKCTKCRNDYLKLRQVAPVIRENPQCLVEYGIFKPSKQCSSGQKLTHDEIMQIRFEARLERACLRRKRRERREKIVKIKRIARPISAVAACLVVGFGVFFAVNQFNRPNNGSSTIASNQIQPAVKIELISGNSTEIIPAGRLITASDGLKMLRINSNRQMVLNIGTELSIEAYNLGCLVKLDKGEIYAEVEHNGKPFLVETIHGRAVITGTTFNIKADNDKMDLAVVEGSVCFESEDGAVDVAGGYQSSIAAGFKPTTPVACNVMQIAKWTQNHNDEIAQLTIPTNTDTSDLSELSLAHVPYCDLEDIDFEVWIDEHREWFEREFTWTKRLQDLLATDGIKVNTIDLLIESGDLWRFAWPEYSQHRILVEDMKVIKKVADQYGIEVEKLTSTKCVQNDLSNVKAFEGWLDSYEEERTESIINSIHATVFLINIRSLSWYAVNEEHIQTQDKQQILDLLEKQVKIASNMLEFLNQLLLADRNDSGCPVAQHDEYIKDIKDDILAIMKMEDKLAKTYYYSNKRSK
ncbi:MAG: FecR domain-containing protein [Chitinivibrionales bacterium]|nr:FecR domain-containing protein [Chitinivibrionales bacterium]